MTAEYSIVSCEGALTLWTGVRLAALSRFSQPCQTINVTAEMLHSPCCARGFLYRIRQGPPSSGSGSRTWISHQVKDCDRCIYQSVTSVLRKQCTYLRRASTTN